MTSPTALPSITGQLHEPDPIHRDVALFRMRLYRFSDDLRHYVLAEALEERLLAGHRLLPVTLAHVRQSLAAIRVHGQPAPYDPRIADAEQIGVEDGLASRAPYAWHEVPPADKPGAVVVIVGSPRSGTSHLCNLLAHSRQFSYLTTTTCWTWPVYNLTHPGRRLFTALGDAVLAVDNKRTRIIPGLVMPGEAEDVWARAIPVYRHLAGHRYEITPAAPDRPGILLAAASAHLSYFGTRVLLAKTPFNSFRIPQIEALWGSSVRYIHIIRDQQETADSMRRNRFEFVHQGRPLPAEAAWSLFVDAVRDHAPADRLVTVTHRELMRNPGHVLAHIAERLDLGTKP